MYIFLNYVLASTKQCSLSYIGNDERKDVKEFPFMYDKFHIYEIPFDFLYYRASFAVCLGKDTNNLIQSSSRFAFNYLWSSAQENQPFFSNACN